MIRVLVVDRDAGAAKAHAKHVARVPGFQVVGLAQAGRSGLDLVESLCPDLVLVDICLPDRAGAEMLRQLRRSAQPVDVFVVTATPNGETIRAAIQAGTVHYLIKPFPFTALRERLERYAEARHRIDTVQEAQQDDVDRVFQLLRGGATPTQLPKGLSVLTCARVVAVLRDTGTDLSATQTAKRAGLSRVSARRYLEWLVATNQAELQMRYGSAGRPEHRYRWSGNPSVQADTG